MTRTKLTLTVLMLVAGLAGGSRAHAQGRASAEWLLWHRSNFADQTLVGPSALDADDASFNFDSGYRFSLGTGIGDWDVEAIFSAIPNWTAEKSTFIANPILLNEDPMGFLGATNTLGIKNGLSAAALSDPDNVYSLDAGAAAKFTYESRLDDFQLNIGSNREHRPFWAALGWRHMELDENSSFLLTGDFQSTDAMGGGPGAGLSGAAFTDEGFDVIQGDGSFDGYDPMAMDPVITTIGALFQGFTRNDLDGGHVVLGGRYQPRDLVTVEVFATAGLFQNRAKGTVLETIFAIENDDDILQRRFDDARRVASFVGGLGFRVLVPLTDYIDLRAGYEGVLITNLALAPEQNQGLGATLLGERFYRVKTGGTVVAHGGHLGLGLMW